MKLNQEQIWRMLREFDENKVIIGSIHQSGKKERKKERKK